MVREILIITKSFGRFWKRFFNEHPTVLVMFIFCIFLGGSNYVQYSTFMSLVVAEKEVKEKDIEQVLKDKGEDLEMQKKWILAINKVASATDKISKLIETNNKIYVQDRLHQREYINLQFETVNVKLDKLLDQKRWEQGLTK